MKGGVGGALSRGIEASGQRCGMACRGEWVRKRQGNAAGSLLPFPGLPLTGADERVPYLVPSHHALLHALQGGWSWDLECC